MEYKSCEWIESRLVLAIDELRFCCIDNQGKGYVPMCDFKGGKLPVDEILEARRKLTEANNDEKADSPCKGCHFLVEKDWKAEREKKLAEKGVEVNGDPPLFDEVYVSHYSICNLVCRYCFVFQTEGTDLHAQVAYDLLPIFEDIIANGYLRENGYIEWGGGEPTILKEFAELEQMLLKRGYHQQVHTSAVRYSKEVEDGLRSGHVQGLTSVDAGDRETYKETKGRDRFDAVWENVARYARTGGNMKVKYILRNGNSDPENVRRFIAKCKESDVKTIVLSPDFDEITQRTVTEETIFAFGLMVHEAKKNGIVPEISAAYLNEEDMEAVHRYVGSRLTWPLRRLRYFLHRRNVAAREARREREVLARRERNRGRTREAIEWTKNATRSGWIHPFQVLAGKGEPLDDDEFLELLEYQTADPDPELGAQLTAIARARSPQGAVRAREAMTVGLSFDGWTCDGKPAYVIVDEENADEPRDRDIWVYCSVKPEDGPVRMTIADGTGEEIAYRFDEPELRRIRLPKCEPGRTRIFAVTTDKTYADENCGERELGVKIETNVKRVSYRPALPSVA